MSIQPSTTAAPSKSCCENRARNGGTGTLEITDSNRGGYVRARKEPLGGLRYWRDQNYEYWAPSYSDNVAIRSREKGGDVLKYMQARG